MKKLPCDLALFLLASSGIFVYLILRAIFVPMAHDEIATFHYYIQTADFLPFKAHWDMNNHVVNSAFGALFYRVFGLSPLVLRLPGLLSFPLFCLYLWKTGTLIPGKAASWVFTGTLLFSHGFLEFFSLSRGYGISMALLMPALYYTIRATGEFTTGRMLAAMAWAAAATLANLSLLNTFLLLSGWMFLLIWFRRDAGDPVRKLLNTLWLLLSGLTPAVFFALLSFRARELGLLYTGGSAGFFRDTVETLVPKLTGSVGMVQYAIAGALFLFTLGHALVRIVRGRTLLVPGLVFLALFCGNILSYILLNRILHVNYPENRVALYLFPLFAGAVCFAAGDAALRTSKKTFLLLLVPFLFFPVHFARSLNLTHSVFYIEDPVPLPFYREVRGAHRPGDFPPTVGGTRFRHFCWSFNDFRNGGTESQLTWEDYPGTAEDFQVADGTDTALFSGTYVPVLRYPPNDRFLMKRVIPLRKTRIGDPVRISMDAPQDHEYFRLFTAGIDSLAGKSIYIGFTGNIESDAVPFQAWIVADARDTAGQTVRYEKLALNWLRPEWKGPSSLLKNGILLGNLPADAANLKVYLWNMDKAPFRISEATVEMYLVSP